jgi:hypothetical protein
MRKPAFLVLFGLIISPTGDAVLFAHASSELTQWQTATGKPPSKNEFAAVVAACEDQAKSRKATGPIEGCLADYGLYRVQ